MANWASSLVSIRNRLGGTGSADKKTAAAEASNVLLDYMKAESTSLVRLSHDLDHLASRLSPRIELFFFYESIKINSAELLSDFSGLEVPPLLGALGDTILEKVGHYEEPRDAR